MERIDNQPKLSLKIFGSDEARQYMFLRHLALTYRAKSPLLAELFQIPEDELSKKMFGYNKSVSEALSFLFDFDGSNQLVACERVVAFYQNLLNALLLKDKAAQQILINEISDFELKKLLKKKENDRFFSDEDIMTIMQYQLKYALSYRRLAIVFSIHRSTLSKRITPLLEKNSELAMRYEWLLSYNEGKNQNKGRY